MLWPQVCSKTESQGEGHEVLVPFSGQCIQLGLWQAALI